MRPLLVLTALAIASTMMPTTALQAALLPGDVINIDFNAPDSTGTMVGAAGYDDPDTGAAAYWNGFTGISQTGAGLYDADGVADGLTGITLNLVSQNPWRSATYGQGNALLYDYNYRQATSGTDVTATLNNVPAGDYQLLVYSFSQYTEQATTPITVNGMLKTTTLDGDAIGTTADATFSFVQGVTYEVFDVSLASAGSITTVVGIASRQGGGTADAILNGMQLVSVIPEPSTLALLGLGGLLVTGLAFRRRR